MGKSALNTSILFARIYQPNILIDQASRVWLAGEIAVLLIAVALGESPEATFVADGVEAPALHLALPPVRVDDGSSCGKVSCFLR